MLLMKWLLDDKNRVLTLPNNRSLFGWEADLVSLTKTGLFHEYEIKLSLSDYEKDFSGSKRKVAKHGIMNKGKSIGTNYFWFTTSGFQPSWIPFYAGWIEIVGQNINIMKPAPRLHNISANMNQLKKCMRSISYRLLKNMNTNKDMEN